jgi:hypothetical protein
VQQANGEDLVTSNHPAAELQVPHADFEEIRFDHAAHQLDDEAACWEPDWSKDSLAVIVCDDNDDGWVMFAAGPHLDDMIDNMGSRRLSDLGLGGTAKCTPGLWIWQGRYVGGGVLSMAGDYSDPELEGTARRPTYDELTTILAGRCPWELEDWIIKPPPATPVLH